MTNFFNLFILSLLAFMPLPLPAQFLNSDENFGDHGILLSHFENHERAYVSGATLDESGRLLVVGSVTPNLSFVARYLTNGNLDLSFGNQGIWTAPIGAYGSVVYGVLSHKEYVLISGCSYTGINNQAELFIARLTKEGVLDPSFSEDGIVYSGLTDYVLNCGETSIDVLDGDIVSAQWYSRLKTSLQGTDFVVRINWDGSYVNEFNGNGRFQYTPMYYSVTGAPLYTQSSDGSFVLYGLTTQLPYVMEAIGFHPDGTPNATDFLFQETIDATPQLAKRDIGGNHYVVLRSASDYNAVTLLKLIPNGAADQSFGTNGRATLLLASPARRIEDLLFIGNRILLCTYVQTESGYETLLSCLFSDGTLDLAFGTNGSMSLPVASSDYVQQLLYNSEEHALYVCAGTVNPYEIKLIKYHTQELATSSHEPAPTLFDVQLTAGGLSIQNHSTYKGDATVSLTNLEGKVLLTQTIRLEQSETSLPFKHKLSPGIYLLRLQADKTFVSKKACID